MPGCNVYVRMKRLYIGWKNMYTRVANRLKEISLLIELNMDYKLFFVFKKKKFVGIIIRCTFTKLKLLAILKING